MRDQSILLTPYLGIPYLIILLFLRNSHQTLSAGNIGGTGDVEFMDPAIRQLLTRVSLKLSCTLIQTINKSPCEQVPLTLALGMQLYHKHPGLSINWHSRKTWSKRSNHLAQSQPDNIQIKKDESSSNSEYAQNNNANSSQRNTNNDESANDNKDSNQNFLTENYS
ncbi:unnamed protein product [Vicia faba]|uniref:Uncharacterized protein n=1 Tax=Vicia faba TaxID=3906 RepID=A0AAV0ZGZ9_VICFA|nr:unnamed protein product [Vicia faba]